MVTSSEVGDPRLQHIESYLKVVVASGLCKLQDFEESKYIQNVSRPDAATEVQPSLPESYNILRLESTLSSGGQLEVDDLGRENFYGQSSGFAFLSQIRRKHRDIFGPEIGPSTIVSIRPGLPQVFDSPHFSADPGSHRPPPLPPVEVAKNLVDYALDNVCVLSRIVHRPTFDEMLNKMYEVPQNERGIEETRFLPLLYAVLALGFFALPAKAQRVGHESALGAR